MSPESAHETMDSIRLALFGKPVAHSPSPGVHEAFGAQFGLDVDYRLVETGEGGLARELDSFRHDGGVGCNITLPLKHAAFELADTRTARAERAAAANTLKWNDDGELRADNTDGEGLVRDLEQNLGFTIRGTSILLLGAGGAASGVLGALLEREPKQLLIANRTVSRARELARRHQGLGDVLSLPLDGLERSGRFDLVVDATSMGHSGERPHISPAVFEGNPLVYSLNYGPAARGMHALSQLAGAPFHDGLGMLVEQAAASFEIWTGHRPETAPVLAELRSSKV